MSIMKDYYELTKSGLVFGNIITVIAGFALGSGGHINVLLLLAAIAGIMLVMASGCVFNNYIDRDIDALMPRTKGRALVVGRISGRAALTFGTVLGILGFSVLILHTNVLTTEVAAFGFFFYVFMYSMWAKRRSIFGALVGSVSGAVPPVVGYAAASDRLDVAAVLLFCILVVWQMPHFFAIAIRRAEEYRGAGIPVMPVRKGVRATKIQMLLYIIEFIVIAPLLTILGYLGYPYFIVAVVLGLAWLALCIKGLRINETDTAANAAWARKMFFFSLFVMVTLFITITLIAIIVPIIR